MTHYTRGRAFEYRVRDDLKARGFFEVFRMAGSHSPADLIAVGGVSVWFVQCKGGKRGPSPDERAKLAELKARCHGCHVVIASRDGRKIVYHPIEHPPPTGKGKHVVLDGGKAR